LVLTRFLAFIFVLMPAAAFAEKETVVLLHGIGVNGWTMARLGSALTRDGFRDAGVIRSFWDIARHWRMTSVLSTPTTAASSCARRSRARRAAQRPRGAARASHSGPRRAAPRPR
jgi:hypothetical protein